MLTYTESQIMPTDAKLFRQIRDLLASVDLFETPGFPLITCHILASAIGEVYGLQVKTGFWHRCYEHSWLISPNGHIIDVYPVGVLEGPILLANPVGRSLYIEGAILCGDVASPQFQACVKSVVRQIQDILTHSPSEVTEEFA